MTQASWFAIVVLFMTAANAHPPKARPMTFAEVASLRNKVQQAERLSQKGELKAGIETLRGALDELGDRYRTSRGAAADDTGTKLFLAEEKAAQKAYSPSFQLFRNVLESRISLVENRLPRSFRFWSHGGEPGTLSRELLIERKGDGTFTAVVREVGMSFDSTPPKELKRVVEAKLPTAEAEAFIDLVLLSPVFGARSAGSDQSNEVADLSIEDWELTSSEGTTTARYTSPFAASQKKVRAACQVLMDRLRARP